MVGHCVRCIQQRQMIRDLMESDANGYGFVFEFDLADRMRKSLRVSGLTVQDIAEDMGVSRNTVSSWINGRSIPSREQLVVWAAYTNAPLQWLQRGTIPKMRD